MRRLEYRDFSRMAAVRVSQPSYCGKNHQNQATGRAGFAVAGSANLVQTLLKHDLVDALSLMIFPITLGGEKRLFADGTSQAAFKVTESTVNPKGVTIVNYERVRAVPTGSL
jgi:dihydrofolate reductase